MSSDRDHAKLKSCALCSKALDRAKIVELCDDCLKIADCCVGLERISEAG